MSQYTPIIITPLNPSGAAVTLPSPDRVSVRPESVTFVFEDPVNASGNGVVLETLLAPLICTQPGQPWLTRSGKRGVVVSDSGAVRVQAQWARVEPFSGAMQNYTAAGALVMPEWSVDRQQQAGFTLVLYVADVIYLRTTGMALL